MFGQMQITRMFQPSKLETADEAVAKLLDLRGVTLDFSLVGSWHPLAHSG
jgi:hypothetical protein